MSLIDTNKLTLFNGGEPLSMGYIYIGFDGLDPLVESNRQTVTFTDSQGNSFDAPQPLRTNSKGQIQWNGKAIEASIDGDYSMLILNSNQTQIDDGWIPTVSASSSGGSADGDYREYSNTLSDLKKLNVSTGQTVGNIGNLLADDLDSTNWLVISNTGESGDDLNLIDFDNGLQGINVSRPGAISGFTGSYKSYLVNSRHSIASALDITFNMSNGVSKTVGPSGSGADLIWSELDVVPINATSLTLHVLVKVNYGTIDNETVSASCSAFKTLSDDVNDSINIYLSGSISDEPFGLTSDISVILDENNTFKMSWKNDYIDSSTATSIKLYLKGIQI